MRYLGHSATITPTITFTECINRGNHETLVFIETVRLERLQQIFAYLHNKVAHFSVGFRNSVNHALLAKKQHPIERG